jgi:hypothetical protein
MSDEELKTELERLRNENAALKKGASSVRLKVSEKGAVSVYGMGRFPVTLYKGQVSQVVGCEILAVARLVALVFTIAIVRLMYSTIQRRPHCTPPEVA